MPVDPADLLWRFNEECTGAEPPPFEPYLSEVDEPQVRAELTRDLLCCAASHYGWTVGELMNRAQRLRASYPEIHVSLGDILRAYYEDSVLSEKLLSWNEVASYAEEIPSLILRAPGEPIGLGEKLLGRYVLKRRLGRGSFGVVFEAWDDDEQRSVAVKVAHACIHQRRITCSLAKLGFRKSFATPISSGSSTSHTMRTPQVSSSWSISTGRPFGR